MLYGPLNYGPLAVMNTQLHENLHRDEDVPRASERSFGILFFVVFAAIAAWPIMSGADIRWWAAVIAMIFAALALIYPRALTLLNSAWLALLPKKPGRVDPNHGDIYSAAGLRPLSIAGYFNRIIASAFRYKLTEKTTGGDWQGAKGLHEGQTNH